MKKLQREQKKYWIGLSVGLGVALLTFLLSLTQFEVMERQKLFFINVAYEVRSLMMGTHLTPSPRIVVLAIDDESLSQENLPDLKKWPWPRALLGMLTEKLEAAGAKVIAFDLLLITESVRGEEDDRTLAEILSKYDNVVIGANFESRIDQHGTRERLMLPLDMYEKSVRYGYVNYEPDSDKNIRKARLAKEFNGVLWDSFDKAIVEKYDPSLLGNRDLQVPMLINFVGPPDSFTSYPVYQVFDEELYQSVLKEGAVFKDKIVLVGPKSNIFQDFHPTPYAGGSVLGVGSDLLMAGVEIHANSIDTLLQHRELHEAPWLAQAALALTLGAMAGILLWWAGPIFGLLIALLLLVGYSGIGFYYFAYHNVMLNLALPPSILLWTYTLINGQKYIQSARDKARYRNLFGLYVPPQVVAQLVSNPELQGRLEGEKKEISVMFIDIRGFTSLSQSLDPVTLVKILNEYSQVIGDGLKSYDGIIDKFIGDGVMITFNSANEQPDHAKKAVLAALDIRQRMLDWLAGRREGVRDLFRFGIGISSGEAVVGNVGTKESTSFTVIGSAVNLAARLEGKARDGNQIIISQATYDQTLDIIEAEPLGPQEIKGFMEPVPIYEVTGKKSLETGGAL